MIYHAGRPLLKFDCRDVRVLDEMFRSTESPAADDLRNLSRFLAEWSVTMLTGPVPNMGGSLLRHRKVIGNVGIMGDGFNCLFHDWHWGYFRLREGREDDGRRLLTIDYDVIANGRLLRRLRDKIKRTDDPDVMLGKFYMRMGRGDFRFLSYFAMTKVL